MINVEVIVDHLQWKKKIRKIDIFFKTVLKLFPKKYQFPKKNVFLTLLLSNNKHIKKLNYKFRKKNKSTDILSFPLNYKIKRRQYLGDIIISYEFMNRPKLENNILFKKKVVKLFIHGFLHLNGYDHKKNVDFNKMQNKEIEISNTVEKKLEKINSK
tara:strand:+ start:281 stop:751 length:471 start_codon:yes stop_codon:yes gene_type:complete